MNPPQLHQFHFFQFDQTCILVDLSQLPINFSVVKSPVSPKFQYGRQAPGMARLTFFLWETTQKLHFLAWGFQILATQKTNGPRDLKFGLKQSLEYPLPDQRLSQILFSEIGV